MHKLVEDLLNHIRNFKKDIGKGLVTDDNLNDYLNEIIRILIDIYNDEGITFVVPTDDYKYVYDSEDEVYFRPFYTSESEIKKDVDCKRKLMSLKELSEEIYDNNFMYEYYNYPESSKESGYEFSEILEYVKKNPLLVGLMLNPDTSDFYPIDSWVVKTVIYKCMGANVVNFYDEDGEEVYRFEK